RRRRGPARGRGAPRPDLCGVARPRQPGSDAPVRAGGVLHRRVLTRRLAGLARRWQRELLSWVSLAGVASRPRFFGESARSALGRRRARRATRPPRAPLVPNFPTMPGAAARVLCSRSPDGYRARLLAAFARREVAARWRSPSRRDRGGTGPGASG